VSELGVLRPDGARRAVRFERLYPATPEELWSAVTEPERLRRWLAPGGATLEPRSGGRFELAMADDGTTTVHGRVLRFEPPRTLEVEWRYEGEHESILTIELSPQPDGTRLVLDHRLLHEDQAPGYSAGWHAFLDGLDDLLRGSSGSWDERFRERLASYKDALAALS
jgi:uncharacterized protein YndB with AHSA1/START domain